MPPPARGDDIGRADAHRVQLAVEFALPEGKKATENGIIRREIEILPDKALQQAGVIRHMVEDFCGRQAVTPQLSAEMHGCSDLQRFDLGMRGTMLPKVAAGFKKKLQKQMLSTHRPRLLPTP